MPDEMQAAADEPDSRAEVDVGDKASIAKWAASQTSNDVRDAAFALLLKKRNDPAAKTAFIRKAETRK